MDSLQKRVMRNARGQLVETTKPISQLAGEAGLQAPPTTPLGAAALGATPKQQDMVGSGSQKQSALRQSSDTVTTLQEATADRRYSAQAAAVAGSDLIEKQKKAAEVFGDTRVKVQGLLDAEIAKLSPPTPTQVGVPTPADQTHQNLYKAAIDAIGTPELISRINELSVATGKTNEQLAAEIDAQAAAQGKATAGKALADVLSNSIRVSAVAPELGTTTAELAELLGIPESQVAGMSLVELGNAVDNISNLSQRTAAQAVSPFMGAAERRAAAEAGQELARGGVRGLEAAFDRLASDIGSSDVIQFGGKTGRWEELLSDESISKLISDYLEDPQSPESLAFARDPRNTALLQFVEKHRDALTQAARQFKAAATEATSIQQFNAALRSPAPGLNIPDNIMKQIYPDWDPNRRESQRRQPVGLLLALQDPSIPEADRMQWGNSLIEFQRLYPDVPLSLDRMTAANLRELFTPNRRGQVPIEVLKESLDLRDRAKSADVDALVSMLFDGNITNSTEAQRLVDEDMRRRALGYKPAYPALDSDGDGRLDSADSLRERIARRTSNVDTVKEALAGMQLPGGMSVKQLTDAQNLLYSEAEAEGKRGDGSIADRLFHRISRDGTSSKPELLEAIAGMPNTSPKVKWLKEKAQSLQAAIREGATKEEPKPTWLGSEWIK